MKIEWIEDLLVLAKAGTFSRAADMRNLSQPAFSRRIQMLENWLQVKLVNRDTNPLELTAAAQRHLDDFRRVLADLNQLRSRMQAQSSDATRVVLTTQHSLTMSHLPPLLEVLNQDDTPRINLLVRSENRDECVTLFMQGQADLLMCMEEKEAQLGMFLPYAERMPLGTETLVPVSAPNSRGQPMHRPRKDKPLRLLSFPPDSFLGRLLYKECLDTFMQHYPIVIVHESVFLAGIKEMIMAGLGMGWLPAALVQRELKSGSLVVLEQGLKRIEVELALYHHAEPEPPEAVRHIWEVIRDYRGEA